jgi:alcohol dehydrogenase (cytochrome c)
MMAFDAATGKQAWHFNTIPMPNEPGAETWLRPETLKTGGGGTWSSYAFDAGSDEVFVPVANPAPDFSPSYRPGANLYTNSVVVLDAKSGKLKWYYQLAPNDGHDYGVGAAPMLYRRSDGADVVVVAAKDGFVYAIDRHTRKLLFKTPVTTIENAGLPPTPQGRRFCPGAYGGVEWNGPALDRSHHALVVGAVDWCAIVKSETPEYAPGRLFMGGSYQMQSSAKGWITSLDADTGRIKWQFQAQAPVVAGITPTAGGVVFAGDMSGNFLALDSASGKLLYRFDTGGAVAGGIVTYAVGGRQYVATTSGNTSRATFGALGAPTIVIMGLPGNAPAAPKFVDISQDGAGEVPESIGGHGRSRSVWEKIKDKLRGWKQGLRAKGEQARVALFGRSPQVMLARGKTLFGTNCVGCHGTAGEGLAGPSLQHLQARLSLPQTVDIIKHPKAPMPALYPSILSDQDVKDLAAFLHTL